MLVSSTCGDICSECVSNRYYNFRGRKNDKIEKGEQLHRRDGKGGMDEIRNVEAESIHA